ncbi:hypothetical protein [Amycolatopsis antarctica]|uniref:hypothetical protein n=1 Tax=Amycolatopsis antarctica TaxID=1854586 RepID=UPI0010546E9C|nr:hypothetical protein [Amycolatopsis antarctica]
MATATELGGKGARTGERYVVLLIEVRNATGDRSLDVYDTNWEGALDIHPGNTDEFGCEPVCQKSFQNGALLTGDEVTTRPGVLIGGRAKEGERTLRVGERYYGALYVSLEENIQPGRLAACAREIRELSCISLADLPELPESVRNIL